MTDEELTYAKVNREERFYCMLLAHCLLSNPAARQGFSKVVESTTKLGRVFSESPDFAVYIEVAALRDFWRELGNPGKWNGGLEDKRLTFLRRSLEWANTLNGQDEEGFGTVPDELLEKRSESPFWTESKRERKLWSPARWSMKRLKAYPLSEHCVGRLMRLRWAFNAKPDILVLEGRTGLLIEAKVESAGGANQEGYDQIQTQLDILGLWKHLELPGLDGNIHLVSLGKRGELANGIPHLTWQGIVAGIGKENMDPFTWGCFTESQALSIDL